MWTWLIFSTQWYFCSATASKPPISPMPAKDGLSPARDSTVVPGRGNSSRSSTMSPLRSRTGTIERAKAPLAMRLAGAGLRLGGVGVDVVAAEALDRRDQVGADALRHEAGARRRSRGPSPTRRRRSPSARATWTRRHRR